MQVLQQTLITGTAKQQNMFDAWEIWQDPHQSSKLGVFVGVFVMQHEGRINA
jgi:hypothetical protein